uniref:Uncharacterized protein n=1 Tax=Hemiselmis andersenii TaxID=464988 RepID=A0A6U5BWJ7_HEMAN|mmetsp:Transcript_57863/g.139645  ORF Transcript_57863/g.139645 Transcript_57863/m.139645 type:complete len:263 (+) Transcript_57863:60-848(+)
MSGTEPSKPKRVWGTPTVSAADTIAQVAANDASLEVVDLSGSAIFSMKSDDYMQQLSDALARNTVVKELVLRECGIGDRGCEFLKAALATNKTLAVINLEKNSISGTGGSSLAQGLQDNIGVREVNLMSQTQTKWTDRCLDDFLQMFDTNVSLVKIVWRLDSRKSFAINKMITRNNEIERRVKAGMECDDVLPTSLKGKSVCLPNKDYQSSTSAKPSSRSHTPLSRSDSDTDSKGEGGEVRPPPRSNKVLSRWPPAAVAGAE